VGWGEGSEYLPVIIIEFFNQGGATGSGIGSYCGQLQVLLVTSSSGFAKEMMIVNCGLE